VSNKQYIETDLSQTKYYSDRGMTELHREDGPAVEYDDFNEWYLNGKRHREDGPAVESADGTKSWYINGKLHREDGPAVEYANGDKEWYINGKLHREDGPAIEYANDYKDWYINGKRLTEEEFNLRMSSTIELTLDEIAKKFGVSVDKLKIKK
jgi:antitoxin component YwqK of YwqJK toxin-antitoxin module